MIEEKAYAKINLTLRILPKRSDLYHGVETIMAPIDLYDSITIESAPEFKIVGLEIENNIMEKVAKIFFEKYHLDGKVKIKIVKKIPVAAGLAGGSSDAAATLRGLNRFYNLNLPLKELEDICNMVGSDVSYCLYQKLAFCEGRGEIVSLLNVNYKKIPLLLVKPDFGLSTALVYKNYQYIKRSYDKRIILDALINNDIDALEKNIFNDLTISSQGLKQELKELVQFIEKLGFKAFQSGSGPTYFILNYNEALLEQIKKVYPNYFYLETFLMGE